MALIMNASERPQEFRAYGSYFSMKPGQIKNFNDHVARFIALNLRYLGLVSLPEELEDLDYRQSPEGVTLLADKRKEGVASRVNHLREVIRNLQVSLKKDMDVAGIKQDVRTLASDGELDAFEELVKYQTAKDDAEQKKIDRIKELESKIKDIG